MRHILTSVVLLVLLFPALAMGGEVTWVTRDDLVVTDGLHYKKFTDVPFTGKVTGKSQGSIKDGKQTGPWVRYRADGQLWSKGTFKDGKEDGPWVSYWDNGRIHEKGTYKDGEKDGPWVSYWKNGQLWSKGTFKDRKLDGPWVGYDEYGTVNEYLTGTYKDGVKVD